MIRVLARHILLTGHIKYPNPHWPKQVTWPGPTSQDKTNLLSLGGTPESPDKDTWIQGVLQN